MGKTIRNSGYVAMPAGIVIILTSYAGYVMLEGSDRIESIQKLYDFRTYVALVPGIVMTSLGWLIMRYQR